MKASETNLQAIIEGAKQYVVPLFQRAYSWDRREWSTLWDDLAELAVEPERQHFIGSIVTIPAQAAPQGVATFLLIDGQQRLTTLLILLAAIRDSVRETQPELSAEIDHTLLRNQYKRGTDVHKLLPTQADRAAMASIIAGEPVDDHRISEAHQLFLRKVRHGAAPAADLLFHAIVARLALVSITLERDDNPHLIFESLNAKGRALTQADLIRNYFLMRVPPGEQEVLYERSWRPMETLLGDGTTEFIRHFLMRHGSVVKQGEVYVGLKAHVDVRLDDGYTVADNLDELRTFANYYARIVSSHLETDTGLRRELERLSRLRVTVAYPFLLNLFAEQAAGRLTTPDLTGVVAAVVNLILRRFICGISRAGLNKEFPSLFQQIERLQQASEQPFLSAARSILASKAYPTDGEFRRHIISGHLYGRGDRLEIARLVLEEVERSYAHKERVDLAPLTVEHVMPQTLTPTWRDELGSDADDVHEALLHTLGNLTLSGYNSELSNAPFADKRTRLAHSHLQLSETIAQAARWDEEAILARGHLLADRIVNIWPDFGPPRPQRAIVASDGVTGTSPSAVVMMGTRYSVRSWREVWERTIEALIELDDDLFWAAAESLPKYITADPTTLRSSRRLTNGMFLETHMSAIAIHRLCVKAIQAADLDSEDWEVVYAAA
ncbi:MAG: DUF262 domain-containing protein [Chloroflexia bacterium]|nr:DUF262 domain-containing protein [Chloroflexia bacterium]